MGFAFRVAKNASNSAPPPFQDRSATSTPTTAASDPWFETLFADRIGVPTVVVLSDGKSLWKSEPVTKLDDFQPYGVRVEKVKVLTLVVHAADSGDWGRVVWLEPVLIE